MKFFKALCVTAVAVLLASCASVKGLKNFAECKFDYKSVTDVKVASIDVSNIKSVKSLKLTDTPKILSALKSKNLPLDLNVNLNVKNPNDAEARLEGFDYILWIDDIEMISGAMDKKLNVGANQREVLSIPFTVNLLSVLSKEKIGPMADFAFGLANDKADASRVKVSIKPYFSMRGKTIKFPSYITVGGDKVMPKKK